jgi:hypothetical protein
MVDFDATGGYAGLIIPTFLVVDFDGCCLANLARNVDQLLPSMQEDSTTDVPVCASSLNLSRDFVSISCSNTAERELSPQSPCTLHSSMKEKPL